MKFSKNIMQGDDLGGGRFLGYFNNTDNVIDLKFTVLIRAGTTMAHGVRHPYDWLFPAYAKIPSITDSCDIVVKTPYGNLPTFLEVI